MIYLIIREYGVEIFNPILLIRPVLLIGIPEYTFWTKLFEKTASMWYIPGESISSYSQSYRESHPYHPKTVEWSIQLTLVLC